MKVWISKHALTKGIYEAEGRRMSQSSSTFIVGYNYFHAREDPLKSEWHTNREAAVAAAEHMRALRIVSLKKQIAKLEKLSFEEES